jgi:hypothetical protein
LHLSTSSVELRDSHFKSQQQVNLILEALGKIGMRINKSKYTFHAKKVEFLNYIMGLNGIKIDPKKI